MVPRALAGKRVAGWWRKACTPRGLAVRQMRMTSLPPSTRPLRRLASIRIIPTAIPVPRAITPPWMSVAVTASPSWLEVADRLASRLCRDALWDGKRCTWLTAQFGPAGPAGPPLWRAAGPDLYAGSAGIALFLGLFMRLLVTLLPTRGNRGDTTCARVQPLDSPVHAI